MGIRSTKISKAEAITTVAEHIKKIENCSIIDISEVKANSENWKVVGKFHRDEKRPALPVKFEVIIDDKGKIQSTYSISLSEKNELCNLDRVSEDENEDKYSKIITPKEIFGVEVRMDSLEKEIKKIEILRATKEQLNLEREKLKKMIEVKASTLEIEIKELESEIKKMKLLLKSDEDQPII